ncbi:hypothetical protein BGZ63DRAFT_264339 [Mariannaea sp. PMI_226]|nr:hypothetical protein BGZ63DRAFT_264339 [Mariannaea sp. PMI_226]
MTSHSKRNTSRAVFTAHERAVARSNWSTSSARLNRDSFLPFGSCGLCLNIARDPVSCRRGDIFCRECALANILAQKKDIKRAEKAKKHAEEEAARAKASEDQEDQERAIKDFELVQAGLEKSKNSSSSKSTATEEESKALVATGTKRKFELDGEELNRIAREDKIKARKAIDDEKATKPILPSFWTPSLTPEVNANKLPATTKREKATPTCPSAASDEPHPISMQNLITINFHEEDDASSNTKRRSCPSCRKVLSNASNPMMAKQCGHVWCQSCVKKFLIPPKKGVPAEDEPPLTCHVCDVPLSSKPHKREGDLFPGLVSLRSEGTGFSARGGSTVEKLGISYSC